jgi:hypothetical protein
VNSAISSVSWATCLAEPVLAWQLWPECLAADDLSTKCGNNLKVLTGRRESGGGGRTESVSSHRSPRASEAGGRAAPHGVTDVLSVLL